MALYTIGDTHLSLGSDKPMDVFGGAWEGYVEKLAQGLSVLRPEDTLVIAGDISWGMSLEESEADFAWLDALPGRKILMKGNHDYWWNTAAKMTRFFAEKGFSTLHILHNNCHFYGDLALCGTRGWFYEEEKQGQNEKVFRRELARLETSLQAARVPGEALLSSLPPFLHGVLLRPHPGAAGAVPGEGLLLRPPPRRQPPPGPSGKAGRGGVPSGLGGLPKVSPGKNLGMRKKSLVILERI